MREVIYKIRVNRPCRLFIDDEEMMILGENKLTKITLPEGEYLRKVVAIDNSAIYDEAEIVLSGTSKLETIALDTTGLEEAKRNAMPKDKFKVGDLMYQAAEDGTGVAVAGSVEKDVLEVVIFEKIAYGQYIYEVTSIGGSAFSGCSHLTSITIPNSVTRIGNFAFNDCSSLTSIAIPNSVTSIGWGAFKGCSSLTFIEVEDGNTIFNSHNNCNAIIETASNTLIAGCQNTIIPDGVTSIESNAFYACSSLKSIKIPNSVTSIGAYVFEGCSSLTSINIPNSVLSIGLNAFHNCSSLTSVVWDAMNVADFPHDEYCSYTPFSRKNNPITSFIFGDNVKHIPAHLCEGMTNLTSINIPNSVTSIGDYAFHGCQSLSSITIPNNVTRIGNFAFYDCSSLTSLAIPISVKQIGYNAFSGCKSLISVTIPNSVTRIGGSTFSFCTSLTTVRIPNSVTSIEGWTFSRCSSLLSITIPNSVKQIGYDAFSGCKSLKEITYQGTKEQWNEIDLGRDWHNESEIKLIHCTNGDIEL